MTHTDPWQLAADRAASIEGTARLLRDFLSGAQQRTELWMRGELRAVGLENIPTEHLYIVWRAEMQVRKAKQATRAIPPKPVARYVVKPDTLIRIDGGPAVSWAAWLDETPALDVMDKCVIMGELQATGFYRESGEDGLTIRLVGTPTTAEVARMVHDMIDFASEGGIVQTGHGLDEAMQDAVTITFEDGSVFQLKVRRLADVPVRGQR